MPFESAKIYSNNLFYGCEWRRDAFGLHVDKALNESARDRRGALPRTALDIGCGMGLRAGHLARTGLFDKVIAVDIGDRAHTIESLNRTLAARNQNAAPVEFVQMHAAALRPEMLEGADLRFVNFRRVGHFLSPADFRTALTFIRNAAARDALVAVSFDGATKNDFLSRISITEDAPDFYNDPERIARGVAPYSRYSLESVRSFMEGLGFGIIDDEIDRSQASMRQNEHHILAKAPGKFPVLVPACLRPALVRHDLKSPAPERPDIAA